MKQNEIRNCLARKLELLMQIGVNTEIQSRFVQRRELRGLRRLLRERAALLKELAAVNRDLKNAPAAGGILEAPGDGADMLTLIAAQETEILERSHLVLQEARKEKERIGAEIKNINMRKQLTKKYLSSRWKTSLQGRRFNSKG